MRIASNDRGSGRDVDARGDLADGDGRSGAGHRISRGVADCRLERVVADGVQICLRVLGRVVAVVSEDWRRGAAGPGGFGPGVGEITFGIGRPAQDASVAVFSVSGGDDKAVEYSGLLERVSAVVLTKIDLRPLVKFDSRIFRADVERINPGAALHEISSLTDAGMFTWLHWLNERRTAKHSRDAQSQQEFLETFVG